MKPAADFMTAMGRLGQPSEAFFPTELIPMGAKWLARGVMNMQAIQINLDWVLPFWVVKQYDPTSSSYIPRAMIGLSQNSTHRDWTGIGCLNSELEGVVDPAGLITPWLDGFSVDIWLKKGGKLYAPSKLKDVKQSLVQNL